LHAIFTSTLSLTPPSLAPPSFLPHFFRRAFGILKARFKGLAKKLWFRGDSDEWYRKVFKACCILHNVCKDMKAPLPKKADIDEAIAEDKDTENKKKAENEEPRKRARYIGGDLAAGKEKRQKLFEVLYD
jgi:hypothetical protein